MGFRKIRNVMRGIGNGRVTCPLLWLTGREARGFMPWRETERNDRQDDEEESDKSKSDTSNIGNSELGKLIKSQLLIMMLICNIPKNYKLNQ